MIGQGTAAAVNKAKETRTVKVWRCGACGHTVPITPTLEGLDFDWYSNYTSKVGCKACGSYTIQKSYDGNFTHGEFLIVKAKRVNRGKGSY